MTLKTCHGDEIMAQPGSEFCFLHCDMLHDCDKQMDNRNYDSTYSTSNSI